MLSRHSARSALAAAAVAALAVAGVSVAVVSPGFPSAALDLATGQVWLPSSSVGQLALVDGSTGEVVTRQRVSPDKGPLSVAQPGADAVVADGNTGALYHVSAASLSVSTAAQPLPHATDLRVFKGSGVVQAVSSSGSYVALNPVTLRQTSSPTTLAAQLDMDTVVVDAVGRLWALDTTGALVGDADGSSLRRAGAATPTTSRIAVAGGIAAIVDTGRHRITALGTHGAAAATACLPDSVAGAVAAGDSSSRSQVLVAAGNIGSLVVADLATGSCSEVIPLTDGVAAALGQPVESGGRSFVPDLDTGQVFVVDVAARRVIARPSVLPGGSSALQLIAGGGAVFFNDPLTAAAGIVRLDGSVKGISKYDVSSPNGPSPTPTAPTSSPAHPTPTPTKSAAGPALKLGLSPDPPIAGKSTQLTLTATHGGRIASAAWTFSDSTGSPSGVSVRHTWPAAQDYFVRATATLTSGAQPTSTFRVTVIAPGAPSSTSTGSPTVSTSTTPGASRTPTITPSPATSTPVVRHPTGHPTTSHSSHPTQSSGSPTAQVIAQPPPSSVGPTTSAAPSSSTTSDTTSPPVTTTSAAAVAPPSAAFTLDIGVEGGGSQPAGINQEIILRAAAGQSTPDAAHQQSGKLLVDWGDGTPGHPDTETDAFSTDPSVPDPDPVHHYQLECECVVALTVARTDTATTPPTSSSTQPLSVRAVAMGSTLEVSGLSAGVDLNSLSLSPQPDMVWILGGLLESGSVSPEDGTVMVTGMAADFNGCVQELADDPRQSNIPVITGLRVCAKTAEGNVVALRWINDNQILVGVVWSTDPSGF